MQEPRHFPGQGCTSTADVKTSGEFLEIIRSFLDSYCIDRVGRVSLQWHENGRYDNRTSKPKLSLEADILSLGNPQTTPERYKAGDTIRSEPETPESLGMGVLPSTNNLVSHESPYP